MDQHINPGRDTRKYSIIKAIARIVFYLFYRKIHISGKENIPEGGSIIFAANHQNALMDALAVIFTNQYQPVYLARADIFKNPFIARILGVFKMMPVYRFRDGMDTMGQNHDTFESTSRVLGSGGCIGIMPEGNHGDQKRLRVLKKGIFRIAFKAGENSSSADIKIVPVGLDYSKPAGFYEELIVNYGRPLLVSDYMELYNGHPQKGINEMKNDLSESMRTLIIDIKDELNYDNDKLLMELGNQVSEVGDRSKPDIFRKFKFSRAFCNCLYEFFDKHPDQAADIRSDSRRLNELLDNHGFSARSTVNLSKAGLLFARIKLILCFPVYMTGALLHLLPVAIIHYRLKAIKDTQFMSSVKFVLGLFLVPLNYIILFFLLIYFFTPVVSVAILAFVPVSGFLAYSCFKHSIKLKEVIIYNTKCRNEKKLAETIGDLRLNIIDKLQPVLTQAEEKQK
ncbi:MAG: lysophospholipid acyltransferase family protein [Bacteroidales bacterium]